MPSDSVAPVRVCTVGNSGSGKSTFARELAQKLNLPSIELDSIFHQPGWTQLPGDEFRQEVVRQLAKAEESRGGWVVDGNYMSRLTDVTVANADVVVWFDLPRSRVMWQLTKRTLSRVATKRELWNGNVERWSNLMKWAPEENILRWAWTQHAKYRETYERLNADSRAGWIRITNPRERDAAMASLVAEYESKR